MDGIISKVAITSGVTAFIGAVMVILSGYGYQWGWWGLGVAFRIILPAGTILGLIAFILGIIYIIGIRSHMYGGLWLSVTGIVLGVLLIGNATYWYMEAQKYPPIHDISTDVDNPPEFDAVVPLREDAPNPIEYKGEEVASIQKEHYPDIGTLHLEDPPEVAYKKALEAARQTSWDIISVNKSNLTIEATHTLPWFGFEDDVVIRVDTTDSGSKIDVRSLSRIGIGDIGVNAQRIRDYFSLIK